MAQEGMDLLTMYGSVGALHNSWERNYHPRRHPKTRVKLIDELEKWLNDVDDPQRVLWLNGSLGTGKSVIADAIARLCEKKGRLLGSFFISPTAPPESGRSDEMKIVATIAHQMEQNFPLQFSRFIGRAVGLNPSLFHLDLPTQIDKLIINPLSSASDEMATRIPPLLILLDALDQLPNSDAQTQIIKAFSNVVQIFSGPEAQSNIPVKLLITSRPEHNIRSTFMTPPITHFVRTISLDADYPANDDIRTFLVEGFNEIRHAHAFPEIFPPIWPSEEALDELIRQSSGQFLHASTVLKYVQSDRADPIQQLSKALQARKIASYLYLKNSSIFFWLVTQSRGQY